MLMTSPSDQQAGGVPRAGRELVILPARERVRSSRYLRNMGIVGLCLAAAGALGWGAGAHMGMRPAADPVVAAAEKAESDRLAQEAAAAQRKDAQRQDAQRQEIRQLAEDLRALKDGVAGLQTSFGRSRQAEDVKGLKASVEAMKQGLDATKSDMAGALSQLSGKLDRVDQGTAQKLAKIAERLDQLERKPDPMPTGSIAPQPPARAAGVPPLPSAPPVKPVEAAAPPASRQPIPGFVLRDVYQGIALVEGRGGYREVRVGEPIPGAGKVEAIERRGRRWVVVTSQGLIPEME
jgi:hypothetical protein